MTTMAELLGSHRSDTNTAILTEDTSISWSDYVQACADRASLLAELRLDGPFHVGVLLDNVPEFPMWLGAAASAGATVVGINPTRRGDELARDVRHTDCHRAGGAEVLRVVARGPSGRPRARARRGRRSNSSSASSVPTKPSAARASASSWSATWSATASPAWSRVSITAASISVSAASTSSVVSAAWSCATAAPKRSPSS